MLTAHGGALASDGTFNTRFRAVRCEFRVNEAMSPDGGLGGAVYLEGPLNGGSLLENQFFNCLFLGNRASADEDCQFIQDARGEASCGAGGAMFTSSFARPYLQNCLFQGNTATRGEGGAIACVFAGVDASNCTLVGNSALNNAGGVNLDSPEGFPYANLSNCILWGNYDFDPMTNVEKEQV